jgi:hypothetical protein
MGRTVRAERDSRSASCASYGWRNAVLVTLLLVLTAPEAIGQGELQGRVLANGSRRPVANAVVAVPRLELRAVSDSLGRYRLSKLPPGEHLVVTRATGFRPDSSVTALDGDETLVNDVILEASVNSLEEVRVLAASDPVVRGHLAGFEDRKAAGIGHFFDRQALESDQNRRLSDILSGKVPGLAIRTGNGGRAWATTGRANTNATCGLCRVSKSDILDKYDIASGAPLACYMDVYLDGAVVYSSGSGKQTPLFNLNRLDPRNIEAIEVYTSTAQIPSQFIRTGGGCGVMLIWTRTSR